MLAQLPEKLHQWVERHIGFVDSAVDRIVPPMEAANDDPLMLLLSLLVSGLSIKLSLLARSLPLMEWS